MQPLSLKTTRRLASNQLPAHLSNANIKKCAHYDLLRILFVQDGVKSEVYETGAASAQVGALSGYFNPFRSKRGIFALYPKNNADVALVGFGGMLACSLFGQSD